GTFRARHGVEHDLDGRARAGAAQRAIAARRCGPHRPGGSHGGRKDRKHPAAARRSEGLRARVHGGMPGEPADGHSHPCRVAPGGTADLLTRTTAQKLSASLGQQFVVESRAGAGGNLGAEFVFRAEPDGYTLLASPPHLLTVNPLLYKLSFDPLKFVPIGIIAAYPNVLLATPGLAVSTLDELIAHARQQPGRLNIASQGNGTISHLSAELLKSMAAIEITH